MPKFSIIIPVCNQTEMTVNCLKCIEQNTSDFEIIIIDNGSEIAFTVNGCAIRNEKNLGFPVAVNQGIKKATGEIIVILNNDVIVTPHWLDHLAAHLQYADMVGPVTNNVSGPQKIDYPYIDNGTFIPNFAKDLYEVNMLESFPWYRLVFFCVAMKRSVIDKIGLLDEQFSPGNFEDDDFCLRAIGADFKLVVASDVFVYHIGSATHKALKIDYKNLIQINLAKFNAKYPLPVQEALRRKCLDQGQ